MATKIIKRKPLKVKADQVFGGNGVFYTFPHGDLGPIEIKIDFAQVPEPTNYYYADSLLLTLDTQLQTAILSFGLRDATLNKFADRIEVVMPRKSLLGPFWLSTRQVEKAVDTILESDAARFQPKPISLPEPPVLAPTLFANMIFIAVGDGESTLDFYHLSPRQTHLAKSQKAVMQIQPTVRVIMSSVLTKHFFDVLRPHVQDDVNSQPAAGEARRAVRAH